MCVYFTSLDTPDSVGSQLGWTWRRTKTVDGIDRFYTTYDALTPKQVSEVAAQVFVDSQLTRVKLATADTEEGQ